MDDFGEFDGEIRLSDSAGTSYPSVDTPDGRRFFVADEGQAFEIRFVMYGQPANPDLVAHIWVDGQKLDFRQVIVRGEGKVRGFPDWSTGHCNYNEFVFAGSKSAERGAQVSHTPSQVGTVRLRTRSATISKQEPKKVVSNQTPPKQVKISSRIADSKKFFETPALSAKAGNRIISAAPTGGYGWHWHIVSEGRDVSQKTIFYDTATNLLLRGILNYEEHAHLLPPVDEGPVAKKRVKREPLSLTLNHVVIDLLDDDDVIITTTTRPRQYKDVEAMDTDAMDTEVQE